MRTLVSPPGTHAFRTLFTLAVIGLVAPACSDSGTEPEPTPTATFQFTGSLAGFPGLDLADARITVTDAMGVEVAATTVPLSPDPSSSAGPSAVIGAASFTATLEVEAAGPLSYQSTLRDGTPTVMYQSSPGTLQGGVDQSVTISSFEYVGPGVEAVAAEIDLDGKNRLRVGEEVTAVALVLNGSGTPIPNVPVHWEVTNGDLELLRAYTAGGQAQADFRATAATATDNIGLTLPTGLEASAAVEIVDPILADATLDLTLPLFPGLYPSHVRVQLHGDLARDTLIAITQPPVTEPSEATLQLAVPVDVTFSDAYTTTVTVLQSETSLYQAQDVAVVGGGAAVDIPLDYTGPGADASTVEIVLQEAEIVLGQSTLATATVKDPSGVEIQGVPVAWGLQTTALTADLVELRQGLSQITVEGGLESGTFEVAASTPTGVRGTANLTLVPPQGADSTHIDFDHYPDGSATERGPLGNEFSEWGVVFSFMPYSFSQGETTRMPHLDKSGDDGWIENGKRLTGAMATGFFNFEYLNPVTEIVLTVIPGVSGWDSRTKIIVLDAQGMVVTSAATITPGGLTHRVRYDGGIGKIVVETGNGRMRIIDLIYK